MARRDGQRRERRVSARLPSDLLEELERWAELDSRTITSALEAGARLYVDDARQRLERRARESAP